MTIKNFTDTTPADGIPDSPASKLSLKGSSKTNGIAREYGDNNPVSMSEFYLQNPNGLVKADPYLASFDGEYRNNNYAKNTSGDLYDIYVNNVKVLEDVTIGSSKKVIVDMNYLGVTQPVEISIGSSVGDKKKIRRRAARQLQIPFYNSDSNAEISVSDFFSTKKVTNTDQIQPDTKKVLTTITMRTFENFNLMDHLSTVTAYTTNTELVVEVELRLRKVNIYSTDATIPAADFSGLPADVKVVIDIGPDCRIRGAGGNGGSAFDGEQDGQAGGTAIEFFSDHPESTLKYAGDIYAGGGGGGAGMYRYYALDPNGGNNRYWFGAGGGGGAGGGTGGDAQANGYRLQGAVKKQDASYVGQGRVGDFNHAPSLANSSVHVPRPSYMGGAGGHVILNQVKNRSCTSTDLNVYSYQQSGCFADKDYLSGQIKLIMSYKGLVVRDTTVTESWPSRDYFPNQGGFTPTSAERNAGYDSVEYRAGRGVGTVPPAIDRRAISRYKCKDAGPVFIPYGSNNYDIFVTAGAGGGWTITSDLMKERGVSAIRGPYENNLSAGSTGHSDDPEDYHMGGFGGAYGDAVGDFGGVATGDRYRSSLSMKSGGSAGTSLFYNKTSSQDVATQTYPDPFGAGGGGGAWGARGGNGSGSGTSWGYGGRGGYALHLSSDISMVRYQQGRYFGAVERT